MIFQPTIATRKGSSDMFTGDVYIDTIVQSVNSSLIRVNSVHFTPGARNAWHSHAVGQYLHIIEGTGLVQEKGGEIKVIRQGETIYTEPGVWHWHGATKDNFMTHLAIWEAPRIGKESKWGDHVTDEEYNKQP
jgi:quercetin dioxygenase-like cupin family protein